MDRRSFIQKTGVMGCGLCMGMPFHSAAMQIFPDVRTPIIDRKFRSPAIESAIAEFKNHVRDEELGWLFSNCFPNTLDTTVSFSEENGKPDTYIITGDIDAMWLRDSSAQVWPYLSFLKQDKGLQQLIAGVIRRQTQCILKDPYANAFYKDGHKIGEWSHDLTDMQPGIHERKWEIDSLCYPIRLAYQYWKFTGDSTPFDQDWKSGIRLTLKTFLEQQRKENQGPYHFQRNTAWATDGVAMNGYGYPVKPNGLICSAFRPSDDATVFMYLIPSNFFAVISLKQASEMIRAVHHDLALAAELQTLASEVERTLQKFAVVDHADFGKIYAYEVNGYGSYNLMDDANVPSLLGLPYLDDKIKRDVIYQNTRKMLLSLNNPFFYKGDAGEGIGGPHAGSNMIWPLGITVRGLTSNSDDEIKKCIHMLKRSHAGTGFMHESFYKDDAGKFTRAWFAWANTLFGEFLWKTYLEKPHLLA